MTIEVCANSLTSAINAQKAGANRIELCQNLWCGGTTPSVATIELAREMIDINLAVLIRPRSGDFCYTDLEYQTIQRDILFCKEIGIDGIVIGLLLPDGQIDIRRTAQLTRLAHPMTVCFHRAFDCCINPLGAISQLKNIGVSRILTSGGASTAIEGSSNIQLFLHQANGSIEIMAGGGINSKNVLDFSNKVAVDAIHLSGKAIIKSPSQIKPIHINVGDIPELDYQQTDIEEIATVVQLVHST